MSNTYIARCRTRQSWQTRPLSSSGPRRLVESCVAPGIPCHASAAGRPSSWASSVHRGVGLRHLHFDHPAPVNIGASPRTGNTSGRRSCRTDASAEGAGRTELWTEGFNNLSGYPGADTGSAC
jgi:hypothetical protein